MAGTSELCGGCGSYTGHTSILPSASLAIVIRCQLRLVSFNPSLSRHITMNTLVSERPSPSLSANHSVHHSLRRLVAPRMSLRSDPWSAISAAGCCTHRLSRPRGYELRIPVRPYYATSEWSIVGSCKYSFHYCAGTTVNL